MVDWVLLAIFVLLAVRGWMRGLVREVIGLAVVVAGLFVSFRLSTPVGQVVEALLGTSADVSRLIAGIVIILIIGIAATIVANVLHYGIKLMPGLSTLNRGAGVLFSVLAGVLVVVVIVSVLSLLPLPSALSAELESSTIVEAATDPEGAAQQTIGVIAGDRVVAVVLEIQGLFGESLMIGPDAGTVRIPAADADETRPAQRAGNNVFNQLNRTRAQNNAAPLVRSEVLDELAVTRATELYVTGRLSDRSSDGRFVFVDLQAAGIPVQQADQVVALASSPRSASEGLVADAASLEEMVDRNHLRAGVGVVKGPLGLLVVIVLAD